MTQTQGPHYKRGKCDYCETEDVIVRGTPIMADAPARTCESCWNVTREGGIHGEGIDIGEFYPDGVKPDVPSQTPVFDPLKAPKALVALTDGVEIIKEMRRFYAVHPDQGVKTKKFASAVDAGAAAYDALYPDQVPDVVVVPKAIADTWLAIREQRADAWLHHEDDRANELTAHLDEAAASLAAALRGKETP